MPGTSIRSQVGLALQTRLQTITTANGYDVGIRNVYYDTIPMGLELAPEDMPAIFLLDDGATYEHEHKVVNVSRAFRMQIWDAGGVSDDVMNSYIRAIGKAIYADSPTAQVTDMFRIDPSVYWVQMDSDETDLFMIEANRIATTRYIVHYRTRPYDL